MGSCPTDDPARVTEDCFGSSLTGRMMADGDEGAKCRGLLVSEPIRAGWAAIQLSEYGVVSTRPRRDSILRKLGLAAPESDEGGREGWKWAGSMLRQKN